MSSIAYKRIRAYRAGVRAEDACEECNRWVPAPGHDVKRHTYKAIKGFTRESVWDIYPVILELPEAYNGRTTCGWAAKYKDDSVGLIVNDGYDNFAKVLQKEEKAAVEAEYERKSVLLTEVEKKATEATEGAIARQTR